MPYLQKRPASAARQHNAKRIRHLRWIQRLMLLVAALPLLQTSGCYPDFLAGLSYELQMLVNNFVIGTASIIIQNVLNL